TNHASRVFDVEILENDIICLIQVDYRTANVIGRPLKFIVRLRILDLGASPTFATQGDERRIYADFFTVHTVLDKNNDPLGVGLRNGIQRRLNRFEIAGAIEGDDNIGLWR